MPYIGTQPKDVRSFGKVQFDFTATQGQTAFTGADDDGKTLGFTEGQIQVYVNGILMDASDYTASGSNTITLASAANANDIITVLALQTNIPNSDYVPSTGGNFSGEVNITSGSFGVGTFSPSRPVTVYHDTLPAIALHNSASNTGNGDGFQIQANSTDAYVWNYENTPINFGTNGAERMRIDNSGNVGIGTNSPSGVLSLSKGSRTLDVKLENTPASGEYGVQFTAGSGDYLGFGAGGSGTAIAIDSSNRVTTPNRPAFDVARNGNNYTTVNPVIFGDVYINVGSHYSTTTGRFTAPVAGMYCFYTSHIKNAITGVSRRRFNKNGAATLGGRHQRLTETTASTYGDNGTFFVTLELSAGDYVTVDQYAGSSYGSREYDYFGGYLIG